MKTLLGFVFVFSTSAFAYEQKNFQLPSDCKTQIEQTVIEKVGKGDENMTVEAIKVVYGGVFKGASFPVVALVKTSDETDPRDVLVKTSAPQNGVCVVELVEILADGDTINF